MGMNDDVNTMTLGELVRVVQSMASVMGEDALVDLDITFAVDDEPVVMGQIEAGLGETLYAYAIRRRDAAKPVFRPHGSRIVTERLAGFVYVAQQLLAGLDGHPFQWTRDEERRFNAWKARRMGCTLITENYAKELGLQVIAGQQPVGEGRFEWGRRRKPMARLYIMECQMERIPPQPVAEPLSDSDDESTEMDVTGRDGPDG